MGAFVVFWCERTRDAVLGQYGWSRLELQPLLAIFASGIFLESQNLDQYDQWISMAPVVGECESGGIQGFSSVTVSYS